MVIKRRMKRLFVIFKRQFVISVNGARKGVQQKEQPTTHYSEDQISNQNNISTTENEKQWVGRLNLQK